VSLIPLSPLLTALGLLGLGACSGPPPEHPSWREQWELIALAEDGGLVDARISVGNTGLLRGQGHLRADRWSADEVPIQFSQDVAPVEVSVDAARTQIHLGWQGLERGLDPSSPDGWSFQAQDTETSFSIQLAPQAPPAPPAAAWQEGHGEWRVEATVPRGRVTGWASSGDRGGYLAGWGTLLHRGGDGLPAGRRLTLLVDGSDLAVGLDLQGRGALSWAWIDGAAVALGEPELHLGGPGPGTVRFASGLEVVLHQNRKVGGHALIYDHLLDGEQWLVSALDQWRERRVHRGWARVRWQGQERLAGAALIVVDEARWTGSVPRARIGRSPAPPAVPPAAP